MASVLTSDPALWPSSISGMISECVSMKIPEDRLLPGGVGVGVDLVKVMKGKVAMISCKSYLF